MNQNRFAPWLVVIASLLWAVDAPFRKYLTESLTSTTIVFMEHVTIAALVLIFLMGYLRELRGLSAKDWLAVVFIGLGGSALATIFFTQSFHYVNPSVAILLQKIQPFIAILLAVVVLKEKLSKRFWLWSLLGIFGAYLVTFPELKITGLALQGGTLGVVFALLAAFFWGGSTVFGRLLLRKISFQAMTAIRFLSALVFLFVIQIYYGKVGEVYNATGKDWLYVFIIAVLAGFVSLWLYYRGLRATSASVATICELAFPFAAVVINWKFLGASLSLMQIFGGIVLLFAVWRLAVVGNESPGIIE